ncbi:MAG: 4-(cytidine 5'-diphospho)-2-C-methyl-D-erythritol kinase [Dorea sp.]|nr:4-(cytidine 5'-diphospho)-2-C-methyl-D-erythritol kinase [Dorea sp.]
MDRIELKAHGKVNLALDVLGRRPNGYHDVKMVMQSLEIYDDVSVEKTEEAGIVVTTNRPDLPVDRSNLAYKAADMLLSEFGIQEGVKIHLEKHIPVAAGMAGGSTDGAAVLIGVNEIFELGLTEQELRDRGVKLGADVPYCIMQGTVLAEGIGEELSRLAPMPQCHVLLAKPPVGVSTKIVYEKLDSYEGYAHPDVDAVVGGLKEGNLAKITSNMGNVLEQVTADMYPEITRIENLMKECGALNSMMSGSGPTVFGIYDKEETAMKAMEVMKESGLANEIRVVGVYNR